MDYKFVIFNSSRPGRPPKRGPVGLSLPASHLSHHPQMKKHRLDNGDYPYENGHMNGEFIFFFFVSIILFLSFFQTPVITLDSVWMNISPLKNAEKDPKCHKIFTASLGFLRIWNDILWFTVRSIEHKWIQLNQESESKFNHRY